MDCVEWKGPGVVKGQGGVVIFVRHGGTYVRIHHSSLRKANADSSEVAGAENPQQPAENDTVEILMHLLLIAMWTLTLLLTLWVTIIKMINSHLT